MPESLSENDPFYKPHVTCNGDKILVEVWADIPGYDGYQISTLGKVRSFKYRRSSTKRRDVPVPINPVAVDGYRVMTVKENGKNVLRKVSRFVLLAFCGLDKNKPIALHNNGVRNDDRLINLRWGTPKENCADRKKHGTEASLGERNPHCKLTESKVREIRLLLKGDLTNREIGDMYNVSPATVNHIYNGRIWKHVTG